MLDTVQIRGKISCSESLILKKCRCDAAVTMKNKYGDITFDGSTALDKVNSSGSITLKNNSRISGAVKASGGIVLAD